ncbi:hypothetical protein GCM10015535_44240 [Streptomyces gelaticus]|uniref:Uncharacterized protein n=1 Tax=Streptomyces gelaticus TaxID=285446 RepID=A0ABQ2W461_9ACTN|nr:hypothetical protein GCM10015535_44240 [Streptomyces gelaticus]
MLPGGEDVSGGLRHRRRAQLRGHLRHAAHLGRTDPLDRRTLRLERSGPEFYEQTVRALVRAEPGAWQ